uniref:Beta-1,3-N-acetylgalactosaminyltransferase 1 (globoside blood group) n=1 Tax=Ursus maritimus TaxID=29073 RepID=A0A452U2Y4_URSMA
MALALLTTLPSRMSLRSLKWSLLLLSLLSFLVMWYLSLPHYNVIERVNWMYFYEYEPVYRIHLDVCQLRRVIAAHGFSSKEIITFWQVMLRNTTCHY